MLDHVSTTVSDVPAVERYHRDYYGFFLREPDGNRVEAACHLAP